MRDFSNIPTCLSFDDIMIVPTYSEVKSRSEPITKTRVGLVTLDLPIISSPMDTITESDMALAMSRAGGMGIIHRFMEPRQQGLMLRRLFDKIEDSTFEDQKLLRNTFGTIGAAIGVGDAEFERLKIIMDLSGRDRFTTLAIDVANGFSSYMKDMIERVRSSYGDSVNIIAGNIATGEGFDFLAKAGANAIRGGIGGGSICKTRIQTGIGVPTLSTVLDSARWKNSNHISSPSLIADGGIRYPGDFAKSIAAGADAVMVGRVLAGSDETPGEIVDGYKVYRGMASKEVQSDRRGGLKPGTCSEGVSTLIKCAGPVSDTLQEFRGGLVSSMTYLNSRTLEEYRMNAKLIRITTAGMEESHAFGTKR